MSLRQHSDTGSHAALLELSAERDLWVRRLEAEYWRGYRVGRDRAWAEGWAAAEESAEREHQAVAARVLETDQQSMARRLRAAESGSRRDAIEHWRKRWAELERLSRDQRYVREARMVDPPWRRDYAQTMALLLHDTREAAA